MKHFLLILKNYGDYREYKDRLSGKKVVDYTKGCGYYLSYFYAGCWYDIFKSVHMTMSSGKIGLYRLVNYKMYRDPSDMIEYTEWQFLGYKDEKLIADMTFEEYLTFKKGQQNGNV